MNGEIQEIERYIDHHKKQIDNEERNFEKKTAAKEELENILNYLTSPNKYVDLWRKPLFFVYISLPCKLCAENKIHSLKKLFDRDFVFTYI